MDNDFSKYQPLEPIHGKLIFNRRGEYSVGLRLSMPEVFACSTHDFKEINDLFDKIVRNLPEYSVLHKQDWFFEEEYKADKRNMKDALSQAYELTFKGRPYIKHECYLYIIKTTENVTRRTSRTTLLNNPNIVPPHINETAIEKFLSTCENIKGLLDSSPYFYCEYLTEADYYPEEGKAGTKNGLLNQCGTLSKDAIVYDYDFRKGVKIGNNHVSALVIDDLECFPNELNIVTRANTYNANMSFAYPVGIGLKANHIYNQYIFTINKDKLIKKKDRERLTLSNYGSVSPGNKAHAKGLAEFLDEASAESTIVRFHANLLLWHKDIDRLRTSLVEANSSLTQMGFIPAEESIETELLYWASFPGNGADLPFHKTCTIFSHQAVAMMNFETNYKDSPSDVGMKLFDRIDNVPVHVDITEHPKAIGLINNRNKLLVSPSGTGKSVYMNCQIHSNYYAGNDQVVIDKGKSYFLLCMYLKEKHGDAAFFEYSHDNPIGFNPFYTDDIEHGRPIDPDKVAFLREMLVVLWFEEDVKPDKKQDAILDNLIFGYYDFIKESKSQSKNVFPSFDTFWEYMANSYERIRTEDSVQLKYLDFESFFLVMEKYKTGGRFGHLLNSRENLDIINKRLCVFEIDKIAENNDLLALFTIVIIDTFMQKLFKLKHLPGVREIIFEELWSALKNVKFARFIEWAERTVRKHEGGMTVVSQQLEDMLNNAVVKNTIVSNSPVKIIGDLSGYKDDMDTVIDLLGLSTHERDQLLGMNKAIVPGLSYKEFLIKVNHVSKIYRVVITKLHLSLFESNQKYVEAVTILAKKYNSFRKVIDSMVSGDIDIKIEKGGRILIKDLLQSQKTIMN